MNGGVTSADGKTRTIDFKYLDDQYSPPKTLENVRLLVEQDEVWVDHQPGRHPVEHGDP